ncbi:hypothetical protein, partial [Salmonella enterica]|uniref:hypothetical protein n=1 Tax=Salmonella enterica TaxID=28901 RepID=UPI00398C3D4D
LSLLLFSFTLLFLSPFSSLPLSFYRLFFSPPFFSLFSLFLFLLPFLSLLSSLPLLPLPIPLEP